MTVLFQRFSRHSESEADSFYIPKALYCSESVSYTHLPKKKSPDNKIACLVITADRGLAGSYNMNVIKEAEHMFKEHPETKFFVVGDYGRHYFERHGIPYVKSFDYTANVPHIREARNISDVLIDSYDSGEINMVYVIYLSLIHI